MQPEELIGLWESAPYDFGATDSTTLTLLADGRGWSTTAGGSAPPRVRPLAWDCPKPHVLELRYDDYEFVRAQYTLLTDKTMLRPDPFDALHLSQHLDSARQFARADREPAPDDTPGEATRSRT